MKRTFGQTSGPASQVDTPRFALWLLALLGILTLGITGCRRRSYRPLSLSIRGVLFTARADLITPGDRVLLVRRGAPTRRESP
jgi:hypothetical protein